MFLHFVSLSEFRAIYLLTISLCTDPSPAYSIITILLIQKILVFQNSKSDSFHRIKNRFIFGFHRSGFDVLPDVRDIRGHTGNAPVRLQHRCDKCARQEYRELHEGRVSRSVRRRCKRGIYQAIAIGGCVDFCDWRNVRWV